MTYTAKCPVCSTNIEYGEDWIGRHYKCNCGVTISLAGPGEKKLDVVPPQLAVSSLNQPKIYPPRPAGPSMEVAWGWTWRVILSLILIGLAGLFVSEILKFIAEDYINSPK